MYQHLRLILQCVFKHFTKQEISAEEFRKQCEQAVQVARPTLIGHTGWPTLLDKILFIVLSIATLGIANVVSKATTGSFCFFTGNTVPIEQKLDEISDLSNNPPGMSSI